MDSAGQGGKGVDHDRPSIQKGQEVRPGNAACIVVNKDSPEQALSPILAQSIDKVLGSLPQTQVASMAWASRHLKEVLED